MLSVIREMAEEGESAGDDDASKPSCSPGSSDAARRRSRARRNSSRSCAKRASSTRAAPACSRSCAASRRRPRASRCRKRRPQREELNIDAIHQELSQYRYCTVVHDRGREPRQRRDREGARAARRLAARRRRRRSAEGSRPHRRPGQGARGRHPRRRDRRRRDREHARADPAARATPARSRSRRAAATTGVVAVVAGDGNRRLFESLGATQDRRGRTDDEPVDAPSSSTRSSRRRPPKSSLLPNNSNVILSAEQAAGLVDEAGEGRPDGLAAGGPRRDARVRPGPPGRGERDGDERGRSRASRPAR